MAHPMLGPRHVIGFIAILSSVFMLVPNETFGRSGGFSGGSASKSSGGHSSVHSSIAPSRNRVNQRTPGWGLLPFAPGYYSSGTTPSNAEPQVSVDINQNSSPSTQPQASVAGTIFERVYPIFAPIYPFRAGCASETVTVPWRDGKEHSINVVRC